MIDVVNKVIYGVERPKPIPICSYLFNLYHSAKLLRDGKLVTYETLAKMIKYKVTLDPEP